MVFKCGIHDLLVQKQFMHLILGNPKNRTPMLYFIGAGCYPLQVMEKNMKWRKKKYLQGGNGFQM